MRKKATGIYTTKGGREHLVCHRAVVDGVLSVAIVKDNDVTSYTPLAEFVEQVNSGPCINTSNNKIQGLTLR